jgi:hypothetical protein
LTVTEFLTPVWPLLEASDPTITPTAWRRLPAITRHALEEAGLAIRAGFADRIPCPVCTTHHVEAVIRRQHSNGPERYYIRCPREMRVEVQDHDRQVWRFNVDAFAQAIAASMGLEGSVKLLRGDRLIHLGNLSFRGVRTEVFLARGLARRDAAGIAASLPRTVIPAVVFVPSAQPPEVQWGDVKPHVFALEGCHHFADGRLGVDRGLIEHAVHRYLRENVAADNVFRCKGDFWEVAFDGSPVKHISNTKGMRYIHRLLWEPERVMSAVDLMAAEAGIDPRLARGTSGEEIDDKGRLEMRRMYQGLLEDRAKAEKLGDETARAVVQKEITLTETELLRRLCKDGTARENSDAERVRKSVSNALRRGIEQVREQLPELWRHLSTSIQSGSDVQYLPAQEVDWILD